MEALIEAINASTNQATVTPTAESGLDSIARQILHNHSATITTQPSRSPLTPSPIFLPVVNSIPTAKVDIYDNARFEQIACSGLMSKYDGLPE